MRFRKILILLIFNLFSLTFFSFEVYFTDEGFKNIISGKIKKAHRIDIVSLNIDDYGYSLVSEKNFTAFVDYSDIDDKRIKKINKYEGYMHKKYFIFDESEIFIGTGNFTLSGLDTDFNIFLFTDDKDITEYFRNDRNLLLSDKNFKTYKKFSGESDFEIFQFPSDKYKDIFKVIRKAEEKIRIFSFSFTDPYFVYELSKSSQRGVEISIISDDWNKTYESPLKYMDFASVIYFDNIHAKCITIDDKITIIGSYNHTYRSREKNGEILLVIYDKNITEKINKKFDLLTEGEK